MTPDEIVAALRPIRLPVAFAEVGVLDALAAFAVGAIAAYLLILIVRPFAARRSDPREAARREILALADLSPGDRLYGLVRLHARLGEPAVARPPELEAALYGRNVAVDFAAVEAAILAAAANAPGRGRRP